MREITTHHDGFGLNDIIKLTADEKDPHAGNASHTYTASFEEPSFDQNGDDDSWEREVLRIQFQHGGRLLPDSTPGVTERLLLAILIDRLQSFQSSTFSCKENSVALTHLETATLWLDKRVRDRANRGVLGKNEK
jgi:hypothetical protein